MKGNETDRVASKSAERALKYVVEKRIFDDNYDLNSDDEVYCTELVWKVYLNEGVDLTQGTFDFLGIPLRSGDYILPGKFINSSLLKKIYEF